VAQGGARGEGRGVGAPRRGGFQKWHATQDHASSSDALNQGTLDSLEPSHCPAFAACFLRRGPTDSKYLILGGGKEAAKARGQLGEWCRLVVAHCRVGNAYNYPVLQVGNLWWAFWATARHSRGAGLRRLTRSSRTLRLPC